MRAASRPAVRPAVASNRKYAVGVKVLVLIDRSRSVVLSGRSGPRVLVTDVWYPAAAAADRPGAPLASADRPFPLIVFGHGFTQTPAPYAALLRSWAAAGYVVAAPVFPLENAAAPGGPDETDLVHQPADVSFVITRLLGLSARRAGFWSQSIDARRIAVAGHSDGGETAVALVYDRAFLDPRIRAAVILSGARIPGTGQDQLVGASARDPRALLAVQGTADPINPPSFTTDFFALAPRPKYLLTLIGAAHLGPYTDEQPQLGIVERVSRAFLDAYLRMRPDAMSRLRAAGDVPGLASLSR